MQSFPDKEAKLDVSKNKVYVIGVGLTKFIKPGNPKNPDYPQMAKQAVYRA